MLLQFVRQALLEQMSVFRAELGIITCAAVLTACSVARQWLQCLQAGIVEVARINVMVAIALALHLPSLKVLQQMCHSTNWACAVPCTTP